MQRSARALLTSVFRTHGLSWHRPRSLQQQPESALASSVSGAVTFLPDERAPGVERLHGASGLNKRFLISLSAKTLC